METQFYLYQGKKIAYSVSGTGNTIVLFHGYLESKEIWGSFATELTKSYQVVTIDILGHGESTIDEESSDVDWMAEGIYNLLQSKQIKKAVIVGHSMGGYVLLALAEAHPEIFVGASMYHSVPNADLPEKKEARLREIELVKQGKKQLIYNVNIPKGFADDNLEKLKSEVEKAKKIASSTSDEGIIFALHAMMKRKDRTQVLFNLAVPVYFAIGKKDNYIPQQRLMELSTNVKNRRVVVFENSGHNSFIEEPELALDEFQDFLTTCKF